MFLVAQKRSAVTVSNNIGSRNSCALSDEQICIFVELNLWEASTTTHIESLLASQRILAIFLHYRVLIKKFTNINVQKTIE